MPMYAIIFNEIYTANYKKIILYFHFEITECIIMGHNSVAKIISQPFRNNDKIVIYER